MSAIVLVIDDLIPHLDLLETKLSNQYYDVIKAKSGEEAISILKNKTVDIILLDAVMPMIDGFQTCIKIKEEKKNQNIPVVMMTSINNPEHRLKALLSGADDFINKPILDRLLFARIDSLVRSKRNIDELNELISKTSNTIETVISNEDLEKEVLEANVLIIDDDLTQINKLKSILSKITNNVKVVESFPFQINKDLDLKTDLVIVSSELIEESGLRICSKIINSYSLKEIIILILVSYDNQDLVAKALDIKVSDYLFTPLDESESKIRILSLIKRKKQYDMLESNFKNKVTLSNIDSLTGLYNRYYFDRKSAQIFNSAITMKEGFAVLVIDLDYFKQVNDQYGHLVGDEVLKQTAIQIQKNVRSSDLIARFGGEEFIVLFPSTTLIEAESIAERIRLYIEKQSFFIRGQEKTIKKTVSIGVAEFDFYKQEKFIDVVSRADKALYKAKEQGRNQVISIKNELN